MMHSVLRVAQPIAAAEALLPSPEDAPAVVTVEHLVKCFGGRAVVDGLSFSVRRGEIFALLGPNGAGKTTTLELIEGYQTADEGCISVLGMAPNKGGRGLRQRIGVMLQEGGAYPSLSPVELLRLSACYYTNPLNPEDLLRTVGLDASRRTPYRRLSGGERQRLNLAAALIGRPEVLILDEPTAAMDLEARHHTWALIRAQQERGVTTLLTTHQMDEAERLADRVAIIAAGRLLALDTPFALRTAGVSGRRRLRLRTEDEIETARLVALPAVRAARAGATGTIVVETDRPAQALVEITAWARDAGVVIAEVALGDTSLEETFLRLTQAGASREAACEGVA